MTMKNNNKMLLGVVMMLAGMLSCATAHGWGSDDMEIFDLVEEVNENFYTLMQINQVRNVGGEQASL